MKRGALELSINTIVVVVIGITLLTLGLAFVKNQFGGLTEISEGVFGTAKTEIGRIHGPGKLVAQTQVTVKQGETKTMPIFVANDGSRGSDNPITVTITLAKALTSNFDETKISARIISSSTATLNVGQEATFTVAVAATKDARLASGGPTDPAYTITVNAGGTAYASGGFIIEIQPSTGIF